MYVGDICALEKWVLLRALANQREPGDRPGMINTLNGLAKVLCLSTEGATGAEAEAAYWRRAMLAAHSRR